MKKALLVVLALVLVAALSVGLTLAFLTDTAEVKNTFTVGNVTIDLDETDVDVYGEQESDTRVKANEYKLIPGQDYIKDPIVTVKAGSENCYVFVKVVNEISDIEDATTIKDQMEDNGWMELGEGVYYQAAPVPAADTDTEIEVFDTFKIKGNADVSAYAGKTITITAYAVQADTFTSAQAAWEAVMASGGFNK